MAETMDMYKSWTEIEMEKFDNLSPEMRELVRIYNIMPMRNETVDQYLRAMNQFYPEGVI